MPADLQSSIRRGFEGFRNVDTNNESQVKTQLNNATNNHIFDSWSATELEELRIKMNQ